MLLLAINCAQLVVIVTDTIFNIVVVFSLIEHKKREKARLEQEEALLQQPD